MTKRWGGALLALAVFAGPALPVSAQSGPANAAQEWGLTGWWAVNCSQKPSEGNSYYGFVATPEGRLFLHRDFGRQDQNDRSEVLQAEPRADGTLALTINFTSFGQTRVNVYTKSGGRTRVMYNSRTDNSDVTVENGVLRHNGRPTPWFSKCR